MKKLAIVLAVIIVLTAPFGILIYENQRVKNMTDPERFQYETERLTESTAEELQYTKDTCLRLLTEAGVNVKDMKISLTEGENVLLHVLTTEDVYLLYNVCESKQENCNRYLYKTLYYGERLEYYDDNKMILFDWGHAWLENDNRIVIEPVEWHPPQTEF